MKGIILAGGTGSRLFPLTKITNKHLLPVGRYPMIFYPIYKLVECNIRNILIVTGVEHMGDVVRLLGSGKQFGVTFTYKVQDDPGGIAQALSLGREFAGKDKMVVLLGDNIFEDSLQPFVKEFESQDMGAKILLKEVSEPQRYGVAEIAENKIISIEEKPSHPKSSLCVTGIYFYDSQVFSFIEKLTPSKRGEYEITDINNMYIKQQQLTFDVLEGWWTDAGTPESLLRANQLAANVQLFPFYHNKHSLE